MYPELLFIFFNRIGMSRVRSKLLTYLILSTSIKWMNRKILEKFVLLLQNLFLNISSMRDKQVLSSKTKHLYLIGVFWKYVHL